VAELILVEPGMLFGKPVSTVQIKSEGSLSGIMLDPALQPARLRPGLKRTRALPVGDRATAPTTDSDGCRYSSR
jgi:hypothetical protein